MNHPKLEFCALLTMAGWLRHRGYAAKSAVCCRSRRGGVLHCSICANPPPFSGHRKAQEPVCIEAFCPEASVERFDESIVSRLAGPGEVQRDAALASPDVEIARHELGALVDPDRRRESHFIADSFQYLHDISAAEGETWGQRWREARDNVDDREHPKSTTPRQRRSTI